MSTWHDVGAADEFIEDEPRAVEAAGLPVAVFRVGEELFALHDLCTHERVPLSEGFVEDGCVECPLHQGLFDLRTGEARKAPCVKPVQTFPLRVAGGRVQIQVLPQVVAAT
ncbi:MULTISPECIES: anthranilate 1,2-dioxygenase ferredoxin subunit AndAb [unclassified Cupriavidus]|uniref:anthranilate 1,2-dioxygenase ferredoxin subunit AndAb n=1 Tax=Cupriavidus TaxID=106589 RepID=UPI00226D5A59|nr:MULTISPECIES: anthranilate 1,2-dioxygenase ferredoxin subunit AndAb [unclassified Cupriavidus]MCY0855151.1 non-heme iron oxygenase ferredoxin subunit [Cupriavidus sp. D39]MDW3685098.1 anthranilate 1,2-dioxygenase ferredoxin subunit AndAb [Cupriavidus sp. CV2]